MKINSSQGKDGWKGNCRNLKVFDESDGLQSNEELDFTSKKSVTISPMPSKMKKVAPQLKSSLKEQRTMTTTTSVIAKNKSQKENQTPTKVALKARAAKLREMGGRKGLQEKLKKMRSPPAKSRPFRPIAVN